MKNSLVFIHSIVSVLWTALGGASTMIRRHVFKATAISATKRTDLQTIQSQKGYTPRDAMKSLTWMKKTSGMPCWRYLKPVLVEAPDKLPSRCEAKVGKWYRSLYHGCVMLTYYCYRFSAPIAARS